MIPSRRLLYLLLAWLLSAVLADSLREWLPGWWALSAALWLVIVLDALLTWRLPPLRVQRQVKGVWAVGVWGELSLSVHLGQHRPLRVSVFDDYPPTWEAEGLPHTSRLPSGGFVRFSYRLRPPSRGDFAFGVPHLRIHSPLGLWQRPMRVGDASQVKVFPDFSRLLGHSLSATDQRLPQAGTIRKRRRGEGTDFRQLREYRIGDSLRAIDWKATARQFKPITREYQEERDQQVVFLLDAGRRMLARDGDTAHFDHALNAMLTLAWVAQKQGDAVGVLSFGQAIRWLAPQKGRTGFERLLAGVYDLHAAEVAPDYLVAAQALQSRLRKRAFVVLITNLRDEDDHALRAMQQQLNTRHLFMCASLREAALDEAQAQPTTDFPAALRLAATEHYLAERRDAIRRLGLRTGGVVDVTPAMLAPALVDRYLEVKESGLL